MSINNISLQKTQELLSSIDKTRKQHILWLNQLNRQLICNDINEYEKLDHQQCFFGQFYNTVNDKILLNHNTFIKIRNTHKTLHQRASKLIEQNESKKIITTSDYDFFTSIESEFMDELDIIYLFIHETHHSIDKLTSLPNKSFMLSILEKEYSLLNREKTENHLVFVDIDFFKNVNDKYGHGIGDRVLSHVSKIFISNLRVHDTVSRFGGEEFLIYLNHMSPKEAYAKVESIRHKIYSTPFCLNNKKTIPISCSFGLAPFKLGYSLKQNITNADTAMYLAKKKGRNRVEVCK